MIFAFVFGIFMLLTWFGLVYFSSFSIGRKYSLIDYVSLKCQKSFKAMLMSSSRIIRAPGLHAQAGVVAYGKKSWKASAPLGKFMALTLLVAAPVLIGTLYMSGTYRLLMPTGLIFVNESQVAQVMNEAKLVPPPDLPPSIFELSSGQQFQSADRDWQKLDAGFVQQVLQVIAGMKTYGYELVLLEGYRSPERQDKLAERGTSVTRASAYQSKHQYGLAADMAFLKNGKLVISETDSWAMDGYQHLGVLAKQAGLVWGGGWSFQDYGHIESSSRIKYSAGPE